jgi:hypothetical protein
MLDLFAGRLGWSKAFLARGWDVVAVDLVEPPEIPPGCTFIKADVLKMWGTSGGWAHLNNEFACIWSERFDFACASSPCEKFSVHGMAHFHPNPPYPTEGIALFEHTRAMLTAMQIPHVMENVRAAQAFVGQAKHHCGPFYLWGNAVPPLVGQGISKGIDVGSSKVVRGMSLEEKREYRKQFIWNQAWRSSKRRMRDTAAAATIPPELANCVADYAERLLEQQVTL